MAAYVDPKTVFPRDNDILLLQGYPSANVSSFVQINNIESAMYTYQVPATVTASAVSDYTSNVLNNLIPNLGHLYLVIPTMNPEDVVYTFASTVATTKVLADGDTNSRTISAAAGGATTSNMVVVRESLRMFLKFPAATSAFGLDQMTTPGQIDWLQSSPEHPNASYMFAITDQAKNGQIQMRFEMPANNLSATIGMQPYIRFYIAFMTFVPYTGTTPRAYTPVPTSFPPQGVNSLGAVSTRSC